MLLAIDPGDVQSAWVLYDENKKLPIDFAIDKNEDVLIKLEELREKTDTLIIEMIASYGMSVGRSIFETCVWIGRFHQAWQSVLWGKCYYTYRKEVKMCLCGSMKAKDSNIRQAIMDRYGSKREIAIGKKASPGPLYGFKSDIWAAMGVAITWAERKIES